jgi:hypothetical protein
MTTREVLSGLERARVEASFREGLGAFLEQCDMVKFAKVRPGPDPSRQVLELGRRLVLRSAAGAGAQPAPGARSAGGDRTASGPGAAGPAAGSTSPAGAAPVATKDGR